MVADVGVLRNATTGAVLAHRVGRATGIWSRGIGLLPRARVAPDEGLWIERCQAIHTIGMRATIDVIFLDRDDRVMRVATGVRPNRLGVLCFGAKSVVELGAGGPPREVAVGDRLELSD